MECINTALTFDGMQTDETESTSSLPRVGSVKDRIFELEAAAAAVTVPLSATRIDRAGLTLNLNSTAAIDVEAPVIVQVTITSHINQLANDLFNLTKLIDDCPLKLIISSI